MRSTSPDIKIEFGTLTPLAMTNITDWVVSDVTIGGEGIVVDATPYGANNVVNLPVGITDHPDVTIEGFFDDVTGGPFELFKDISDANTSPYTLRVTWTSATTPSKSELPCRIKSYQNVAKVKDVTRFRAVLTQAGEVVQTVGTP